MGMRRVNIEGTYVHSIVFWGHNILKIDKTLEAWTKMQFKFMDEEISWEEYEDWKANWPDSLNEDYVFDKNHSKHTTYKQYIDRVQKQDDLIAIQEAKKDKERKLKRKK